MEKEEKIERFKEWNKTVEYGKIVCAGSSLMEMFPVNKLAKEFGCEKLIYNRAIGGFVTDELLQNIDVCILNLRPKRLFINIGTNDLSNPNVTIEKLMENYEKIITIVEEELPKTEIYLMAYYPVNYEAASAEMKDCLKVRSNEKIRMANQKIKELAERHGERYIDVNWCLKDEEGRLKTEYTVEGLHINEQGYRAIFPDFYKYIVEAKWK